MLFLKEFSEGLYLRREKVITEGSILTSLFK